MKRFIVPVFALAGLVWAQSDTSIVATVGPISITAGELMTSYEFGPAFVHRHVDPLRTHLTYMVNEALLAIDGERRGFGGTGFVRWRQKALEEDRAVEELYRQDILSQVSISEDQTENDIRAANTRVSLRWIVASSRRNAEAVRTAAVSRNSFDSLYAMQGDSLIRSGARSHTSNMLDLERYTPDLAGIVKQMTVGEVSRPIQKGKEFYIIRLDSLSGNVITTQTAYAEARQEAIEIRKQIEADELAEQYIGAMMKVASPVIKANGFNIVRAYLADKGLSKETRIQWKIPSTFMTEAGPQPIGRSGKYLGRPLVTYGEHSLQVRDFIDWYEIRQFQLSTGSEQAFTSSVRKCIWKLVQDRLLSDRAYARGLNRLPAVQRESAEWRQKLLYLAARSAIVRTIDMSDSARHRYYRLHQKDFRDKTGTVRPYQEVSDAVRTEYYYSMETEKLFRRLDSLKQEIPVTVNDSLLTSLSKTVTPDRRAIDAVFYKPGGTFPHVAVPTIDEAWSRME